MSPSRSHTPHISSTRGGVCGFRCGETSAQTRGSGTRRSTWGPPGPFSFRPARRSALARTRCSSPTRSSPIRSSTQVLVLGKGEYRDHFGLTCSLGGARRAYGSNGSQVISGHLGSSRVISGHLRSSRIDLPRGRNLVSMRSQSRPRGCSGSGAFCHKDVMFGTSHRSSAAGSCSGTSTEPSGRRRPRANQVINSSTAVQPSKSRRPSV